MGCVVGVSISLCDVGVSFRSCFWSCFGCVSEVGERTSGETRGIEKRQGKAKKTYLVLTTSNGASNNPATPAASTATPKLTTGFGLSTISNPPAPPPGPLAPNNDTPPGSGRFSTADSILRIHVSMVLESRLYRKVTFVPFQMPQEPSRDQSCERTSVRESGLRRSSL